MKRKVNYQRQTLDEERPKAEESLHDKTRYDALDLRNPRAGRVLGQRPDEARSNEGKCGLAADTSVCFYQRNEEPQKKMRVADACEKEEEGGISIAPQIARI